MCWKWRIRKKRLCVRNGKLMGKMPGGCATWKG
jgi:hypothetical protein